MPVVLSSLRVTAELNSSQYVAGMKAKVTADKEGAASSQAVGTTVTETARKISDSGGVLGRLSRSYVDGFGTASRFNKAVNDLGRGIETGNVSLVQAEVILDGIYKKFGLAANASEIAERGQLSLASAVSNLNARYATQNEIVERAARATQAAAAAQNYQSTINARLGVRTDFGTAGRAADIAAYGQQLDALRAKFNPLFAAGQQYRVTLGEIRQALTVGALSQAEYNSAIASTKAAFANQVAGINAARSAMIGGSQGANVYSGSLAQLSFQINDVVSGVLMGQKPFQIFAQQGGQIFQVWQMNRNVFKELKEIILSAATSVATFLGPVRLITLGFAAVAAAAYGMYRALKTDASTAEALLKQHARLLGLVKEAYDRVTQATSHWFKESKNAVYLQLLQQQIDLQQKLREEVGKTISGMTRYEDIFGMYNHNRVVKDQFAPFEDAIFKLQDGFKQGTPNVKGFVDEVARISLLNPALQKMGVDLIAKVGDASKLSFTLAQVAASIKAVQGLKLTDDEKRLLGLSTDNVAPHINAYQRLTKSVQDRIDVLKIEAATAGQSGDAVIRLKLQLEAENAARKSGVQVNQQWLDQKKEEIVLLTRRKALADLQSDITFDRSQIGLSDTERQINSRLRAIYGNDVSSAQAQFYAQQLRINVVMKQMSDIGKDALQGFVSDLRAGKSATEALGNALSKVADKLISMAIDNIWSKAFGGVGNSIFSSIFGGSTGSAFSVGPGSIPNPSAWAGIAHSGGIIGGGSLSGRYVHPSYFENAPRFHTGGLLAPDEMPIIARRGEEMLTRSDPRHALNGGKTGGDVINMYLTIDARGATQGVEDRIVQRAKAEIVPAAVAAVRDAKRRRVKGL